MKLEGLKVIDLSVFLPGPYLTMCLADHGAQVIKVEPPGGDPARQIGLSDGESSVLFRNLNRGKQSLVLDLKDPAGREALLRLCGDADVFVESFRPGVVDRLGVGYEAIRARNPGVVYCSISAFGQDGPYRDRPAHDLAVEAIGGLIGMTLGRDGEPAIPGVPIADLLAALQGLSGILMALYRRERTGQGDFIDIGMHDAVVAALPNIIGPAFAEDRHPVVQDERTTGGAAFYQVYDTADGRQLVLGGQEEKFVRALLDALGRPDLIAPCLQGPGPHQAPVKAFLRETFLTRPLTEWMQILGGLDLCFGPVNSLPEAVADPNAIARGMVVTGADGRRWLGPAVRFAAEPARPHWREPQLDEHAALAGAGVMAKSTEPLAAGRYRESFGRYFEDFTVGDVYEHRPGRTISEADNTWFTLLTMNTHPLHFDAAYAAKSEFGRPLVNSCLTLSIVVGMSVSDVSYKAIGNLGFNDVRLTAPVFAGDTLYADSEVLAKRASKSRPAQGLVTVRTIGRKADGTEIIRFERTVLVPKRGHGVEDAGPALTGAVG